MSARTALALAAAALAAALATPGAARSGSGDVAISADRAQVRTELGRRFELRSIIANRGREPARGLIAHLNILSRRGSVYVDPEDWSSSRTRYLRTIPPGGSTTVVWPMHAVNGGTFAVYVAVLDSSRRAHPPRVGPAVDLAVRDRRLLDSGHVLPLALGVPASLALALAAARLRRRP